MSETVTVLVTGGAGFLGRRLLPELRELARERGSEIVLRTFDLEKSDLADESVRGDVTDAVAVRSACEGVDVVVHTAALVDFGRASRERIAAVNEGGTRNVLEAARAEGVRGVVHTSTMDVVMDGGDLVAIDESQPLPERFNDAYSASKAAGEKLALGADGEGLRVSVLRPCGMYGEADPYHMDNVLKQARSGRLTFRMGSPDTVFQHVYVGNVAHAHALAALALLEPEPVIAGRAYFVTDEPASNFFEFMAPFVEGQGVRMPTRTIPKGVAKALGAAVETFAKLVAPVVRLEPVITRSSVSVLVNSISIESDALARDLGYRPKYGAADAHRRVMEHYDGERA